MKKILLFALVAVTFSPLFAFGEPSIELTSSQKNIASLDSVLVFGQVTGVAPYSTVNLTVLAPDGEVVYSPNLTFDDDGNFKRLIHPPLPSFKQGIYTVVVSHDQVDYTKQIQFTVTTEDLPRGILSESVPKSQTQNEIVSDLYVVADAMIGDTEINISGKTIWNDKDITLTVSSPNGNLITVDQVSPSINGEFSTTIKVGGPMWKEDGAYVVTAHQGDSSELKYSIRVEISDGVVVPEFGTIAAMILVVSIISIIVISAKSRLSFPPKL